MVAKHEGPCRSCGLKPPMKNSARCSSCVETELRRVCDECGTSCSRKAKHCKKCSAQLRGQSARGTYRTHNGKGYVRIRVVNRNPPHPLADHPRVNNGYLLEHMIVMEEFLGRQLLPEESVHHKNGQRDDNRLENLELWSTSQPYGQRVEDKVKWALEILETYNHSWKGTK